MNVKSSDIICTILCSENLNKILNICLMNWSGIVMLEENNKMVNKITTLVNEVKSKLSKEINNSIIYVEKVLNDNND